MRTFQRLLHLILLIGYGILYAQVPQGINYQGIARENGVILANQNMTLRFTIFENSVMVYQESIVVASSPTGTYTAVIGQGLPIMGSFSNINWSGTNASLQIELDKGSGFVLLGIRPLQSVPYALHAESAQTASPVGPALGDLTGFYPGPTVTAIQGLPVSTISPQLGDVLKWNGTQWVSNPDGGANFTAGPGIGLTSNIISNTGDTDATDDITNVTSAGGDLSGIYPTPSVVGIQGRNIANTLPAVNEVLKWTGTEWRPGPDNVASAGGSVNTTARITGDGSPTNELDIAQQGAIVSQVLKWNGLNWSPADDSVLAQSLSINGSVLSLNPGGGSVNLPFINYSAGVGISILGSVISNTGDANAFDDLTIGSSAFGDLSGFYPSPTVIRLRNNAISPIPPANNQVLKFNNGQWVPSVDETEDLDSDPANEIQTLSISGNTLNLSNGGSTVNLPAPVWAQTGNNAFYNTGNVGIGTNAPTSALSVAGNTTLVNGLGETRVEVGINNDEGFINIYDSNNALKAGIHINGSGQGRVFGDVKNFRMDHPNEPDKEIWYASLEGPEAAAYARGTATLKDGKAVVEFPEHYQLVSQVDGMTVLLTPLSGDSKGLAVIKKTEKGFEVIELLKGQGNYAFDWEVKCIRRGYDQYQVIRSKSTK